MVPAVDLDELTNRLADRAAIRTEADVQSDVRTLLLYGGLNLHDSQVNLESPAPQRRRIDVEVGSTVIEVKKDLRVGNVLSEAVLQLEDYVRQRTAALGRRYVGLLTDGADWRLHTLTPAGQLVEVAVFSVIQGKTDPERLCVWLESVLATKEQVVPTPIEIVQRLGATSPGFTLDLVDLRAVYESCKDIPEVRTKRQLWARLLAAALGTHFSDEDELFIVHTYLVIVAELIAHAAVELSLSDPGLSAEALVTGKTFEEYGIGGVVEPDFFDWPIDGEGGERFVLGMARRLARFDWSNVAHDVLKVLYESIIDAETRKRLGEYYTPDWLAERIVSEVVDDPLTQRVLDPACGSGTFLFWAVRKYMEAAEAAGKSNAESIQDLTRSVFGIDLHPVAVTLARVTYLLAIGTIRLRNRGAFSVPVYLGDSIQFAQDTSVLSPGGITIYTSDGLELFAQTLHFPESVVSDASSFDALITDLANRAVDRKKGSPPPPVTAILNRHKVGVDDRAEVETSFKILCHLHDNGRDHIWGYYIRNLARPLEFTRIGNKVDRLIGNVPWLAARFMNASMRQSFRVLSEERGILSGHHAQRDLAGLFVVRSVELYLKDSGHFGFVMPYATLTRGQYSGFRTGHFSGVSMELKVRFGKPWDLSLIKPDLFPVPASVVFGTKDPAFVVPLPKAAVQWAGVLADHYRDWDSVKAFLSCIDRDTTTASLAWLSPYGDLFRTGAPLYPRVLLFVEDAAAPAIGVPMGLRSVRSRRGAQEKKPWKSHPGLTGLIETDFVRPVHLGETLLPFRLLEPVDVVVPWDGKKLLSGSDPDIDDYPGLAAWWRTAEKAWNANAVATNTYSLTDKINYIHLLESQFPPGSSRVVYTKTGVRMAAARLDNSDAIVENGLYWAQVSSVQEGQYLCSLLNSETVRALVEPYQAKGALGARHFEKYMFLLPINTYDPQLHLHRELARAGGVAEDVAAKVELPLGVGFQKARSVVRLALAQHGVSAYIEALTRAAFGMATDEDFKLMSEQSV